MLHVALGWEYRGRRVAPGNVIYLALEGQDGFGDRADAFRLSRLKGGDVPGFYLVKERTDLVRDHPELIKCIESQCGGGPSAVVIDTMNRSLVGSESKDEHMAAYIKAADAIREKFECAVIVIHHCGTDETRPRGHTSLTGAADVQISVKRDQAGKIIAKVECAKDMAEGAVIASRLEIIDLGADQDGDQITSCIVNPAEEDGAAATAKPRPARMPKSSQTALRALKKAISETGEPAPESNHIPPNVRVTTIDRWREYAYRIGVSSGEERAQQKAFKSASEYLINSGNVAEWDAHVWVTP